jgi:hypothetical protein
MCDVEAVRNRVAFLCEIEGNSERRTIAIMTWIRTIPMSEADEKLRRAIEGQKGLYPKEYGEPVHPDESGGSTIVG